MAIRAGVFAAVLGSMVAWESLAPRRERELGRGARWPGNLGLAAFGAVVSAALGAVAPLAAARAAADHGWGLVALLGLEGAPALAVSVVLLDLAVWVQHRLFHAVPLLWRLHAVHHADPDLDATSGLRFHPGEIALSIGIKSAVVLAMGAPVASVLVFEVVLNATSLFNHANARIPAGIDRRLRWVVVTPDMHRVHHSVDPAETDSNFGFNLPWWDRLLGTYRDQPALGHDGMTLGLAGDDRRADQRIRRLLAFPASVPRSSSVGRDTTHPTP